MSKIKIIGKPPACVVEIDGRPTETMSLDFHMDGNGLPEVAFRPPIFDVDVYVEGDVKLDEESRRTMIALGWTPPADGDGHKPEMSDVEFDRRLAKWMRVNPGEFDAYMRRRARLQGHTRIIEIHK